MKGPIVRMTDALVRTASDPTPPAGDVILAVLAGDERLGTAGARFLVDSHPEFFAEVRYALGEFEAFPSSAAPFTRSAGAGITLRALGDRIAMFETMFRNAISPTAVRGRMVSTSSGRSMLPTNASRRARSSSPRTS